MILIIPILAVVFAAIFKAMADTIKHHPDTSVFKNKKFWISEGKIFPLTKYKIDGWHLSNTGMIASFLALIFSKIPHNLFISYGILGIIFILIFNIFYNKILKTK